MTRGVDIRDEVNSLAARFSLPDQADEQLLCLLELVTSDPLAPTTVRDPFAVARDHLADSLVALELDVVREARQVADLGAGAGFPGLPLAIALPGAHVHLIESSARKCEFMRRAISATAITNATVVHVRAEEWHEGLGFVDLVAVRALAPLAVVAEYAAPLLRIGGSLVAWRGRRDPDGEAAAARAASELGLEVLDPLPVQPYREAQNRHLHLMRKAGDTPPRFPRRPGVASKRPLGGV